jgi:hypothetical protein
LARQEGQSNFLSLLAGVEAGPDTTEDAAALAFIDCGLPPAILVAKWAGSQLYKPAICQLVFDVMDEAGDVKDGDRLWVKAAILDAFALFTTGICPPGAARAKKFKARAEAFYATRKFALAMLQSMAWTLERDWIRARFTGN